MALSSWPKYYRLEGHEVVPIKGELKERTHEWAKNMNQDRHVAYTVVGKTRISTVFLGLDHNLLGNGPPLLFETMIFDGPSWSADYCERYSTWAEAEEGHIRAVEMVEEKNTSK